MDFPAGVTVTVREPVNADADAYGDTDPDAPTETSWGPCGLAPRTSSERADNNTPAVVTGLTIYGPVRAFTARSQVVIAAGTYAGTWDVEGLPGEWSNPFTGWAPGVEVAVTRATAH